MAGCVAIDLTVSSVDLTVSSGGGAEGARAARRKRLRPEAGDTIDLTREGHGEGGGGSGDKPRARGGGAEGDRARLRARARRGDPLRPNTRDETCPICLDSVSAGCGVLLSGCAHAVCSSCLGQQMSRLFDDGRSFEAFACPLPECRERLSHRELRAVLGEGRFGALSKRSLDQAVLSSSNLFACKASADCHGMFCWDGGDGRGPKAGTCEVCQKQQCIVCGVSPFHRGHTCAEAAAGARKSERTGAADTHAAAEAATRAFITSSSTIRQCAMCSTGVERREGCAKMQCRCGYRFCFECGAPGATCGCTPSAHGFWDNRRMRADFSGLRRGGR